METLIAQPEASSESQLEAMLASFVEAPPLTREALEGTFWRLFDIQGRLVTSFMVLAPEGLIGNSHSPSLDVWQLANGELSLSAVDGTPSATFKFARIEQGQLTTLGGTGTINGVEGVYLIHRVDHPRGAFMPATRAPLRAPRWLKATREGHRRPNLVVLPAGPSSLHPFWLEQAEEAGRNWDLALGWYGPNPPRIETPHEYLAHIPLTKKWRLLSELFLPDSPLWDYEAVWLPDDDLLTSCRSVNLMFHLFRKFGLDLAQPAMMQGPGCHPNHPLTVQQVGNDFRPTEFVEIMCPVFSRRALKICIGSMHHVVSGYGLDHLWPALLGTPRSRIGVIDAVPVAHTRPIGATYDLRGAIYEQKSLHRAYEHRMKQIDGVL
jgi:hypothetical protein